MVSDGYCSHSKQFLINSAWIQMYDRSEHLRLHFFGVSSGFCQLTYMIPLREMKGEGRLKLKPEQVLPSAWRHMFGPRVVLEQNCLSEILLCVCRMVLCSITADR